jgi:serine/threonine protein kinase
MSIAAGTSLGSYEVIGSLGAGAMGEVYRARDRKLDREVAIKILPEAFAQDRERLVRFEREAKLLAAVKHSAIAISNPPTS